MMTTISHISKPLLSLGALVLISPSVNAEESAFLDRWALTIPGGGAGWLQVTKENGYYDASILWGGGSVVPVDSVFFSDDDTLIVTRINEVKRKDSAGETVRTHRFTDAIVAKIDGDKMDLTLMHPNANGEGVERQQFTGTRIAPLPPKPDLASVKYGDPVTLFDGSNLDHWQLINPKDANGWSIVDGALSNDPKQEEGKPHKSYGNLRTKETFEDFNLKLEVMVPEGGNSGIYLRGIYEIQVAATYGKPLNSHNMGGIYSRVVPAVAAEKPAGEWQTYDITLVDRHVTVILNGKTIHDNVSLQGCTGGALTSDETKPGPIYLQGDHTRASYKNIVLRPVAK
ncbi:MAG: DUF1080 domain-containing protein [Verrucomicrobiales bacterium]